MRRLKKIKEFLIDIDWIICQIIGIVLLMKDMVIPGCIIMMLSVYFAEKDRRKSK